MSLRRFSGAKKMKCEWKKGRIKISPVVPSPSNYSFSYCGKLLLNFFMANNLLRILSLACSTIVIMKLSFYHNFLSLSLCNSFSAPLSFCWFLKTLVIVGIIVLLLNIECHHAIRKLYYCGENLWNFTSKLCEC